MRRREYQQTEEEIIQDCQRIIGDKSTAKKFLRRVLAVNMFFNGSGISQVCKTHGIARQTFSKWLTTVEKEGVDKLRDKEHKGRVPRLSEQQLKEIKLAVENDPQAEGYNVWDGPSLSDFILKKYGVTLGVRRCQYMFHEMGFSLIRPQTFPNLGEGNEDEREAFKKR